MTRKIPKIIGKVMIGKEEYPVELTMEALLYLNDLDNNQTDGIVAIGTRLSGVAQKTDAIISGTQVLSDVRVAGRGSLVSEVDVVNTNVGSVAQSASSGGALAASISPPSAAASANVGSPATTGSVTVTASGGTAPYTFSWAKKSGDTVTVTSPASNVTTFSVASMPVSGSNAVYTCTVTDSVTAFVTVDCSVWLFANEPF